MKYVRKPHCNLVINVAFVHSLVISEAFVTVVVKFKVISDISFALASSLLLHLYPKYDRTLYERNSGLIRVNCTQRLRFILANKCSILA